MFAPCPPPLPLPGPCRIAACRFDPKADALSAARELAIPLPDKVTRAVAKRRAEYLAGRYCAREALNALGGPGSTPIPSADNRAPVWPEGYLGSITHCQGFAAAAVAPADALRGLGIDSEYKVSQRTADNVAKEILTAAELQQAEIEQQGELDFRLYLTLIFSAKESLYKCLHPLVHTFFGFDAAEITLDPHTPGEFRFTLTRALDDSFPAGYTGTGQYRLLDDYAHTCVLLPPSP